PTWAAELIVTPGFDQFGWLKKFVAVSSQRKRARSPRSKCLAKPMSQRFEPGPLITPLAALPKKPAVGAENAPASNQRSTVRRQIGVAHLIGPDRHLRGRAARGEGRAGRVRAGPLRRPELPGVV